MKSKNLMKCFLVIGLVVAIYGLAHLYYHLTDDFHEKNISYPNLSYAVAPQAPLNAEEEIKIIKILQHQVKANLV